MDTGATGQTGQLTDTLIELYVN